MRKIIISIIMAMVLAGNTFAYYGTSCTKEAGETPSKEQTLTLTPEQAMVIIVEVWAAEVPPAKVEKVRGHYKYWFSMRAMLNRGALTQADYNKVHKNGYEFIYIIVEE